MANEETSVREAAKAFHEAITQAEKAGFRVDMPTSKDGLQNVAVSETGKRYVEEITLRPVDEVAAEQKDNSTRVMPTNPALPLVTGDAKTNG